jgi:hypothetical protein
MVLFPLISTINNCHTYKQFLTCTLTYTHQSIKSSINNLTPCFPQLLELFTGHFFPIFYYPSFFYYSCSELHSSFSFIYLQPKTHFRTQSLQLFLIFLYFPCMQTFNYQIHHILMMDLFMLCHKSLNNLRKKKWQDRRLKEEEGG